MALSIIILAAGKGQRMKSDLPKVLHRVGGKTLLEHVAQTAATLNPDNPPYVVVGYQAEKIRHHSANLNVTWVEQSEQLGTGHAVLQALPHIPSEHQVLILCGDVPLITSNTLQTLINNTPTDTIGIITTHLTNPFGFGRIIRDSQNNIQQIVEEKDASHTQRACNEVNSGIYVAPAHYLKKWLPNLKKLNTQNEYYLTEIINLASRDNVVIHSQMPSYHEEVLGVNDRVQLSHLERFYQRLQAEKLMRQGVTLFDPARFDLRGELTVGQDVSIDINVIIEGRVAVGNHCSIGANTLLRNVTLGDRVAIKPNSVLEGVNIAEDCVIGPFARIRPGTEVAANVQIGNFIEIKNSIIGTGTKIHHVGYIGDSELGKQVNIGAGTITCNYDGVRKHKTIIGDNAFIGSNTELVAPVTIGEHAVIGAGSTITRDAPAHQLTLARALQRTIENWRRTEPKKDKET